MKSIIQNKVFFSNLRQLVDQIQFQYGNPSDNIIQKLKLFRIFSIKNIKKFIGYYFLFCTIFYTINVIIYKKIILEIKFNSYSFSDYEIYNIPKTIYSHPYEFPGWTKIQRISVNNTYIQQPIGPLYFGNLINICIPQYTNSYITENKFIILHNAIMIHPGYFITPNFIFKDDLLKTVILRHEIESNLANSIQNNIINFTKRFHPYMENAIAIQHLYAANYYHLLLEILPSLFFIKKEIIETSYFLYRKDGNVGFDTRLFHKIFKFFGFKTLISNMVNIRDQMIMVKNLLILTPKHLIELDKETLLYMKEFIFKKYFDSISKSKPNNLTIVKNDKIDLRYILCDYVPFRFSLFEHKKRKIVNEFDLISTIENKYKKVKFERAPIGLKNTMLEQLVFFHETILAIGVHSGSFANLFWMMPKTITIEFQFKDCYSAVFRLSQIFGLRLYSMMFPNSIKDGKFFADVQLVMHAFEYALKELNQTFGVDYT